MPELLSVFPPSAQLPAGEQRGAARRRLSHLPVCGEGADQTLQRPQLFSSGEEETSLTHLSYAVPAAGVESFLKTP